MRRGELVAVDLEGADKLHWTRPEMLDADCRARPTNLVHILSPFDPLVLQRKRLQLFFGYEHRFEAYVPKPKRVYGYFALPVLVGDEIVAAIDLKTDREQGKLLVQQWTWIGRQRKVPQAADRGGPAPLRALPAGALNWRALNCESPIACSAPPASLSWPRR